MEEAPAYDRVGRQGAAVKLAMQRTAKLYAGDLVEVRAPLEILQTLDSDGTLGGLPFMPEMAGFCGKRFRISSRVLKTCVSIAPSTTMRVFKTDDVVTLDGPRCSGVDHDGCQKGCLIFWREAWLRKPEDGAFQPNADLEGQEGLRTRLRTWTSPDTYFCQASELLKVTDPLPRWGRFGKCFREVKVGNCSVWQMAQRIGIWVFWKIRQMLFGKYARGSNKSTPVESLNLRPGELAEVKPIEGIIETLDERAHNRGLSFTPDMRLLCGDRQLVARRLDKIIVDGTGKMRQLRNTVYLEGSHCGCSHVAFGGCPRQEFSYWREIWLRRTNSPDEVKIKPCCQ
jgi:hypothetical protein